MSDPGTGKISFRDQIRLTPGGEKLLNCYLCGTCTAGCPISEIDPDYSPRKIMRLVLLDKKEEVLSSPEIWHCYQCHTCVAHCPQDTRFADVMRAIRRIAVDEGYVPSEFAARVEELDLELRKERVRKVKTMLEEDKCRSPKSGK